MNGLRCSKRLKIRLLRNETGLPVSCGIKKLGLDGVEC